MNNPHDLLIEFFTAINEFYKTEPVGTFDPDDPNVPEHKKKWAEAYYKVSEYCKAHEQQSMANI